MARRQCMHRKADGRLCSAYPLVGGTHCYLHSPDHAEEVAEARKLGGLRRRRETTVASAFDLSQGLTSVPGIQRLLEIAAMDVLALENSVPRARTLAYLGQISLKCLEKGVWEAQLKALEAALASRAQSTESIFDLEQEVEEKAELKELTP